MSPLKKAITFNADTLFLKYPVKNSREFKVMPIDISEEITGKTEIFSMVDRIDLLKIPLVTPRDADILFINEFIDENYLNAEPEEVVVFGYPTNPGVFLHFIHGSNGWKARSILMDLLTMMLHFGLTFLLLPMTPGLSWVEPPGIIIL